MVYTNKCLLTAMWWMLLLLLVVASNATQQDADQEAVLQLVTSALNEIKVSNHKTVVAVQHFGQDLTSTIISLGAQVDATGPVLELVVIIRFLLTRFFQKSEQVFQQIRSTYSQILNTISDRVQQLIGISGIELMAALARAVDNHEDDCLRVIFNSNAHIKGIVKPKIATIHQLHLEATRNSRTILNDVLQRHSDAVKQLESELLSAVVVCHNSLNSVSDRAMKDILSLVKKSVNT